jgi:hypothetical protein
MKSPQPDIKAMSAKLRLQVCTLLGLDPEKLSAGDEVLVSRVGALKLLVSDMEAAQLRGEQIDLPKYIEASKALEDAVRADHQVHEMGAPQALEDARNRLREVLGILKKPDDGAPSEREQMLARIKALEEENQRMKWGGVAPSPPEPVTSEPVVLDPKPDPKPAEPAVDSPWRTEDKKPPPLVLKHYEPWEIRGGGAICPPHWAPKGGKW